LSQANELEAASYNTSALSYIGRPSSVSYCNRYSNSKTKKNEHSIELIIFDPFPLTSKVKGEHQVCRFLSLKKLSSR